MKYEEIKNKVRGIGLLSEYISNLKAAYHYMEDPEAEIIGITVFPTYFAKKNNAPHEHKFSMQGNLKELFMKALEDELSRSVMRKEQLIQELEGEDYMRPSEPKKAKRK